MKPSFDTLPPGGLFDDEAELLWEWASTTEGTMLEVGSAYGRSAVLLGNLAKDQGRKLICVDPWAGDHGERLYQEFTKNVKGLPITAVRMRVEDWTPESVGFAYLDGDHSYEATMAQIEKALACGAPVIAIHDYGEEHGGLLVHAACQDTLGKPTARADRMVVYWLK